MERRKILIIGGGIAGAACAWALTERRMGEVLVLEREDQLGSQATAQNAGILRTLTNHPATTALALETAAFLAAPPPGFCSVPLVNPVGLALIPRTVAPAAIHAWRQRKAPGRVSTPDAASLAALLPHYRGERKGAIFVHDEGHIDTAALFEGFVRGARRGGARFETGVRVIEILRGPNGVGGVLLEGGRELSADVVVIAAGGWAGPLARAAGSNLTFEARRRHLLVTAADDAVDEAWPVVWSEPDAFYAKPESGGLMICVCDEDPVDPDHCTPRPEVRELVAQRASEVLAGQGEARAAHFWAGLRTFSDDGGFTIGFDADVRGLFWVAGLGGHGMSTSLGVGRAAAALLCNAKLEPNLERALSPARFFGAPA
jgi:D-arginine dehydrogenase